MFDFLDEFKKKGFRIKRWDRFGYAVLFPMSDIDVNVLMPNIEQDRAFRMAEALRVAMQSIYFCRDMGDLLFSSLTMTQPPGVTIFVYIKAPILKTAGEIAGKWNLKAEIFENIFSVGVGGDEGTYMPVVNLVGPFPGHEIIEKISIEITNTLPVNRVTYQVAERENTPKRH